MRNKSSGKQKFFSGILQFLWAELKTLNRNKIRSLFKIGVGYLTMKYFAPKKLNKNEQLEIKHQKLLRQEHSNRLRS
ncbi:MAG: hypothetical protein H0V66_12015 [Bdellovibrionales bacterium]|nr:hypothetical protein [Bdellovibrionales bacterium]